MLTTTDAVKLTLGIDPADTTQDAVLDQHVAAADGAVKRFTKRDLERALYTEVHSTRGEERLALRQRPVSLLLLSATLTQGLTTATVPSGASGLVDGMPAVLQSYLPVGTTVSSVVGTTVTLSAAATRSGAVTVAFGVAVWLDVTAYFGMGVNPFRDATHLWPGSDYSLDVDGQDVSNSGLLVRLGGGSNPFSAADWPYGYPGPVGRRGTLTARLAPSWPRAAGCVRAVYCAGYAPAAVPADLELATRELAIWLYRYVPQGGVIVTSESYEGYSYALGVLYKEPALGSTRQVLTRYRETSV